VTATPRVLALLEPVVSGAGYDLEDLTVSAAGKRSVVRVLVDKDGGVTLDDVADVSRLVSEALDAADEQDPTLLGATYVLEVSSPGVDRPLTEPRHWRRNVGRRVSVVLRDGSTADGRITAADDAGVTLDGERELPWAEVARGLVQVEFTRKDEAPGDVDDLEDDDLDEEDDA
jgi:ribosome maturation factor RimP